MIGSPNKPVEHYGANRVGSRTDTKLLAQLMKALNDLKDAEQAGAGQQQLHNINPNRPALTRRQDISVVHES